MVSGLKNNCYCFSVERKMYEILDNKQGGSDEVAGIWIFDNRNIYIPFLLKTNRSKSTHYSHRH